MKTLILFLLISLQIIAQSFEVIKIRGNVEVLIGSSEKWKTVKVGDTLSTNDIVATGKNSLLVLKSDNCYFKLKSNAALKLNYIRKLTLDELLLALTMDELKNLKRKNKKNASLNTAIYGSKIDSYSIQHNKYSTEMGIKALNGAKYLAENGFLKSSVLAAKETFSKFPFTRKIFNDRLFFANILFNLGLYNEALQEYQDVSNLSLTRSQKRVVESKIAKTKKIILQSSK